MPRFLARVSPGVSHEVLVLRRTLRKLCYRATNLDA
jgi:hypothetical protein